MLRHTLSREEQYLHLCEEIKSLKKLSKGAYWEKEFYIMILSMSIVHKRMFEDIDKMEKEISILKQNNRK